MVVGSCHPHTLEVEEGGAEVQVCGYNLSYMHIKFKGNCCGIILLYIMKMYYSQ